MTIAFAQRIPESLLRELFESDRRSGGTPTLPPESRELAVTWLRRILVDFESLDQHIALLQKLYGASFRYPRPRRDQWDAEQPIDPPSNSTFTHADRLPDDEVATVLDKGIDKLSDDELGALLLNPYALFDLFDCIDDVQPEYWLDALHDLVATQSHARRKWPPFVETKGRPESTASHHPPMPGTDDATMDLHHSLDSALFLSKQLSEVLVREAATSQKSPRFQYLMTFAACIGFIAATWGVAQLISTERVLQIQLAALTRQGNEHPSLVASVPPSVYDLHSTTIGRRANWQEIWTNNYLASDSDKDNLDRLVVALNAQSLVSHLRAVGHSDKDILVYLKLALDAANH